MNMFKNKVGKKGQFFNDENEGCCPEDVYVVDGSIDIANQQLILVRNDGVQVIIDISDLISPEITNLTLGPGPTFTLTILLSDGSSFEVDLDPLVQREVTNFEYNPITNALELTLVNGTVYSVPLEDIQQSLVANTIFVQENGDDATGVREDRNKAFRNYETARQASLPGDTIIIYAGEYTIKQSGTTPDPANYYVSDGSERLFKNNVKVFAHPGVKIIHEGGSTASDYLSDDNAPLTSSIQGYADIEINHVSTTDPNVVLKGLSNTESKVEISCQSLKLLTGMRHTSFTSLKINTLDGYEVYDYPFVIMQGSRADNAILEISGPITRQSGIFDSARYPHWVLDFFINSRVIIDSDDYLARTETPVQVFSYANYEGLLKVNANIRQEYLSAPINGEYLLSGVNSNVLYDLNITLSNHVGNLFVFFGTESKGHINIDGNIYLADQGFPNIGFLCLDNFCTVNLDINANGTSFGNSVFGPMFAMRTTSPGFKISGKINASLNTTDHFFDLSSFIDNNLHPTISDFIFSSPDLDYVFGGPSTGGGIPVPADINVMSSACNVSSSEYDPGFYSAGYFSKINGFTVDPSINI